MNYRIGNAQHVGSRSTQQDSFGFSDPGDKSFQKHGGLLAVVADGMGGLEHGDAASKAAVRAFLAAYRAKIAQEEVPDALMRSLRAASQEVAQVSKKLGDIGTTLVAGVVTDDSLYWISVGDSSLFLLRDGRLTQVNTPHTYATRLDREVAEGKTNRDVAAQHPERESLTSYLGPDEPKEVDLSVQAFPLRPQDHILICSDGLSKVVSDSEISTAGAFEPQDAAERLVQAALRHGGESQDNVTVLTIWGNDAAIGDTRVIPKQPSRKAGAKPPRIRKFALAAAALAGIAFGGVIAWNRQLIWPPAPPVYNHHPKAVVATPKVPDTRHSKAVNPKKVPLPVKGTRRADPESPAPELRSVPPHDRGPYSSQEKP